MIVTHIDGRSEMLTDFKSLQRKKRVNGEYSLSFLLVKTDNNIHSYDLAIEESLIEYDGQEYRIKGLDEKIIGQTPVKQIRADHVFFDLIDTYKYDFIKNTQTMGECLRFALDGTGFTFDVVDPFNSQVFEKFGDENSLILVQNAMNTFGAEVEINNKHLRIYNNKGRETDITFRYKHNVKTIDRSINTNNLSTIIKGFGKRNEDGSYVTTASYESPMVSVYGRRDAKPIYDERFTNQANLLEYIKGKLIDKPEVSFKIDAVELKKIGVLTEQIVLGDNVYIIYEPLNIDITARVMEITDFPESHTTAQYTFENFRNNLTETIAGFDKTKDNVDNILNGQQKLPFNVLDDAVIRATESLQSAETQLNFDDGIKAIDPNNPNRVVWLNSQGIGISKNGGQTFSEAITADGFVLSAGAIGQLSANNVDVTGVITTINSAGNTTTIDGGKITTDTIEVNKLKAGMLTGFGIQTEENTLLPRIFMSGGRFEATDGGRKITIDPADWGSSSALQFNNGSSELIIQNYDDRSSITGTGELEIWMPVGVRGSFDVQGAKNASVPTSIGYVNISAYETAEYYFGDIGRGEVVNGECIIEIEELFKETVNTNIDYEVFLTPYGKGMVYVDGMNADTFTIKGDDIPFVYEIKAKRKNYETVRLEMSLFNKEN